MAVLRRIRRTRTISAAKWVRTATEAVIVTLLGEKRGASLFVDGEELEL